MSADKGKPLRAACVLGLLLALALALASAESTRNATAIVEHAAAAAASKEVAEARMEEESLAAANPWTRNADWRSGGSLSRGKDSYLEALKHSRTSTDPREGIVAVDGSSQRRREQSLGPVYAAKRPEISRIAHGDPDRDFFSMLPSDSYSLPTRTSADFGAPGLRDSYGPPRPSYGPPQPSYDYSSHGEYASAAAHSPPQQAYGAPVPYGNGPSSVQLALPSVDFSWPFSLKLNAFTLAKILLKLVIFKMIVKFIAVICLLLFIPKLEIKKGKKGGTGSMGSNDDDDDDNDDEDEGRSLLDANSRIWQRVNLLTTVVYDALRQHGIAIDSRSDSAGDCSTLDCRVRRAFERDRSWPDYQQLLQSYLLEETRLARANS